MRKAAYKVQQIGSEGLILLLIISEYSLLLNIRK